jgi:hypothetical protein
MPKDASSFVCQNCGAVNEHSRGECEACGELRRTPRLSFASLLMSVPFGDFERDRMPVRDIDL